MQIIYHYHPITREYTGSSLADRSPADKTEVYLVPAFATTIEPPSQIEGKIRTFTNDSWEYFDIPTPQTIPEPTEEEIVQMQINEIQRELENLDNYMTRPVENQIKFLMTTGYEPYQKELDVIARKEELREQLQNLE
jgi:hypothetical protein